MEKLIESMTDDEKKIYRKKIVGLLFDTNIRILVGDILNEFNIYEDNSNWDEKFDTVHSLLTEKYGLKA